MQRYLLRIAFNGHKFHGAQTMAKRTPPHLWTDEHIQNALRTVQGTIETIAYTLMPKNEVIALLASRTDAGVHALNMPIALDLQRSLDGSVYFNPRFITNRLNIALSYKNLDMRVLKTVAVNGNFRPRSAFRRSYVYRFAILNREKLKNANSDYYHSSLEDSETTPNYKRRKQDKEFMSKLPISDKDFFTERHLSFDAAKAEAMLQKLVGTHDFTAFSNKDAQILKLNGARIKMEMPEEYFHRKIDEVTFSKISTPFSTQLNPIYDLFEFYEFSITASSFYRNQIRRIAAVMFQVGGGRMDLDQIDKMLSGQIKEWPQNLPMAAPNGLYLYSVEYPKEMTEDATDDVSKLPLLPHPDENLAANKPVEWDKMRPVMIKIFQ